MDSFRNHWFYMHFNRLTLRSSIHFSPFNLDEDLNQVVYAGIFSSENIVKAWSEWWKNNRDKPFHIEFTDILTNGANKNDA